MRRKKVSSSGIHSIGYLARSKTLEVKFHSGKVYQYLEVPVAVYRALMQAPSHGAYYNLYIKPNYSFRQIV
ncbi:MAG: KTSC domain-containing protein [Chitinophagales bacterium]